MSQIITQNIATDVVVVLTKPDITPVTGLAYTDVTVQFKREGESSFNTKTLSGTNFNEVSDGVYLVTFTASEVNLVGSFIVRVTGATIVPFVTIANILAFPETTPSVALQTVTMTGQISDLSGNPVPNSPVSVRILGKPDIEHNSVALSDDLLTTKTDNNGEFFMNLVVLADVEVFIPQANYRRRFVVPNTSTFNLFTDL